MKTVRFYGLFTRNDAGKWEREFPALAYPKPAAIRIFQDALLAGAFSGKPRELRPVPASEQAERTARRV